MGYRGNLFLFAAWSTLLACDVHAKGSVIGPWIEDDSGSSASSCGFFRENGDQFCSGTLVQGDRVVSAAHCAGSLRKPGVVVRCGKPGAEQKSQVVYYGNYLPVELSSVREHPGYFLNGDREKLSAFDLAVVQISPPMEQTEDVRTVGLPRDSEDADSLLKGACRLAAWGTSINEKGEFYSPKRRQTVDLLSNRTIEKTVEFPPSEKRPASYSRSRFIYYAYTDRNWGPTYSGDSGGSLLCQRPGSADWVLVGVHSGKGETSESLAVDLASQREWLDAELGGTIPVKDGVVDPQFVNKIFDEFGNLRESIPRTLSDALSKDLPHSPNAFVNGVPIQTGKGK